MVSRCLERKKVLKGSDSEVGWFGTDDVFICVGTEHVCEFPLASLPWVVYGCVWHVDGFSFGLKAENDGSIVGTSCKWIMVSTFYITGVPCQTWKKLSNLEGLLGSVMPLFRCEWLFYENPKMAFPIFLACRSLTQSQSPSLILVLYRIRGFSDLIKRCGVITEIYYLTHYFYIYLFISSWE